MDEDKNGRRHRRYKSELTWFLAEWVPRLHADLAKIKEAPAQPVPQSAASVDVDLASETTRPDVRIAVEQYNAAAKRAKLRELANLTPNQAAKLIKILDRDGKAETWRLAMEHLPNSPWHCGKNENGWWAKIDWFLDKPDKIEDFAQCAKNLERERINFDYDPTGRLYPPGHKFEPLPPFVREPD